LFSLALAAASLAPWVPTWKKDLPRIFKLANLNPGEIFYDLGCGNGKVVFYAAKNFPIKAIGIELAFPLYLTCKLRQLFNYKKNLKFWNKDIFKVDLSPADVIYIFGTPKPIQQRLKQKLEKELKPGARIISYAFPFNEWQPKIIDKPSDKDINIYLYQRS
jgi:SAM-dependent methyltransferase